MKSFQEEMLFYVARVKFDAKISLFGRLVYIFFALPMKNVGIS
jgi:hypothetical protein